MDGSANKAPAARDWRAYAYWFSIALGALVFRVLVGMARPGLAPYQDAAIGLTAAVCLAPTLYRVFFGQDLLPDARGRVRYGIAVGLSGVAFAASLLG